MYGDRGFQIDVMEQPRRHATWQTVRQRERQTSLETGRYIHIDTNIKI